MKISFKTKSISNFFNKQKADGRLFKQQRDWKINITVFLITSVVIILGSLLFYWLVNKEMIFDVKHLETEEVRTFSREKLKEVVEKFEQKQKEYESLKSGEFRFVDPNL